MFAGHDISCPYCKGGGEKNKERRVNNAGDGDDVGDVGGRD